MPPLTLATVIGQILPLILHRAKDRPATLVIVGAAYGSATLPFLAAFAEPILGLCVVCLGIEAIHFGRKNPPGANPLPPESTNEED